MPAARRLRSLASVAIATKLVREPAASDNPPTSKPHLRWWLEICIIAAFYGLYSLTRDVHGTNDEAVDEATANAHQIIVLERTLHIFYESQVQHAFLHQTWFISFLDDFYGSAHFVAVAGVLAWLFFAQPTRYRFWRNVLAACTALALVGFTFYPLLPPRLLPSSYHFVDTLRVVGGLWNFSGGPANDVSNQYAAMPSLHTGWSTWCVCAVIPAVRPGWAKVGLLVYPALTVFCIVVTANHFFLDAVGGLVVLAVAFLVMWAAERYWPPTWPGPGQLLASLLGRLAGVARRPAG